MAEEEFANNCDRIPGAYFVQCSNYTEKKFVGKVGLFKFVCLVICDTTLGNQFSPVKASQRSFISISLSEILPFDAIETNLSTPISRGLQSDCEYHCRVL